MRRDLGRLTASEFDLLVVGAGIYGATAAWDATQRGLSVALIDKNDFGSGTSFNNAKTVHGGVRSLQRGHVREMREYLRERRALSHILPHLVHPLPFLLPTRRALTRHKLALGLYFRLSDLLARDRNAIADAATHLPPSRIVSRAECLRLAPAIDPRGVTGGAIWYDAQFSNSDRATLAFIRTAVDEGLTAANHVDGVWLLTTDSRASGVMARDVLTGRDFPIRARSVLLSAGGWTDEWLARALPRPRRLVPAWSVGMNVVLPPMSSDHAVGGDARGRLFFLAPWRGATIAGTSHDPWNGRADQLAPRRQDVQQLLADLQTAFPRAGITADDVRLIHRGLLPATYATPGRVTLLRHSPLVHHAGDGRPGLVSLVGVRYTTARHAAQHAIDLVTRVLGVKARPCGTAATQLDGGRMTSFEAFQRDARQRWITAARPAELVDRLVITYGTRIGDVLDLAATDARLRDPLGASCAVTGAEILYACREEMALRLGDAVLRRTEAGSRGHPGMDALHRAAGLMGDDLGWSAQRREDECRDLARIYDVAARGG